MRSRYCYFLGAYIGGQWVDTHDDSTPFSVELTHWMPLPPAPRPEGRPAEKE